MKKLTILLVLFVGCARGGGQEEVVHVNSPDNSELQAQIYDLQQMVAILGTFIQEPFKSCSDKNQSPLEEKLCKMIGKLDSVQLDSFMIELSEMVTVFNNALYGEGCTSAETAGCPGVGSISYRAAKADINEIEISDLKVAIAAIESEINALDLRVGDLETRIAQIEDLLNGYVVFEAIPICHDIPDSGPVYESLLLSGDEQTITAYFQYGNKKGLGLFKKFGDGQGDVYYQTTLNTAECRFKIYEDQTLDKLRICWNNNDRLASTGEIDSACDLVGDFANPTEYCTCTED